MKIVAAPQDEIRLLDNWVKHVLMAIADERDCPRMADAFVTDESHVGDFYGVSDMSDEEYHASVQRIAERLNITINDVKSEGYIVNMARKMARGDE